MLCLITNLASGCVFVIVSQQLHEHAMLFSFLIVGDRRRFYQVVRGVGGRLPFRYPLVVRRQWGNLGPANLNHG
jgi:hypothetical protein